MTEEEKIFRMYELMHGRVINWDHLLSERTNMFLLISSILFAGFVTLYKAPQTHMVPVLTVVLPVVGIFLSFLLWCINSAGVRELNVYIAFCYAYELEEKTFEFLCQKKTRGCFTTLRRWFRGNVKPGKAPFYHARPFAPWEKKIIHGKFHAHKVYKSYIPLSLFVLWGASLVAVLARHVSF